MYPSYSENEIDIFRQPFRMLICGQTNSGKSHFLYELIQAFHEKFHKIIIASPHPDGGSFSNLLKNKQIPHNKLVFMSHVPDIFQELQNYRSNNSTEKSAIWFILDDFADAGVFDNQSVSAAFTRGRHENLSITIVSQNCFAKGKFQRNISLNSSHIVLFYMRDKGQVRILANQIFGGEQAKHLVEIYEKQVIKGSEYGYILIDLSLRGGDKYRLLQIRTNILPHPSHYTETFEL